VVNVTRFEAQCCHRHNINVFTLRYLMSSFFIITLCENLTNERASLSCVNINSDLIHGFVSFYVLQTVTNFQKPKVHFRRAVLRIYLWNLYCTIFDEWSQKWIFYKTDYIDVVLCHVVIWALSHISGLTFLVRSTKWKAIYPSSVKM